jgi:hypothetical protein
VRNRRGGLARRGSPPQRRKTALRRAALLLPAAALLAFPCRGGGWDRVLASVGLDAVPGSLPVTVLEGDSPEARRVGISPSGRSVRVASVEESRDPDLEVVWEKPVVTPVYEVPADARVFTRERWTGAPLAVGIRRGGRKWLWTATDVGEKGYERYPYLVQSLADLGVEFPFRSWRIWAFFDSSYRLRADSDFLARRWRTAGIAAIHAAAWHFYEPNPARDEYLKNLIAACHREGVLVYAWLELPHVSEKFWDDHPEWREKTAILQDAHLDWRKLMNLADPACSKAAEAGLRALMNRFDWDGLNLAELYFESLYGPADPQRFTPMNRTVRAAFEKEAGLDPVEFFRRESPHYWERDRSGWGRFVEYRARLAGRLQAAWLERARLWRPGLDLALTQIDDRLDSRMKENLGSDSSAALRLLDRWRFTFIVEDPATAWHLGPERYAAIARQYAAMTPHRGRLAVDINVVPRYQDVYPTKKQTGTELFELTHLAAASFPRVALYFEQSIHRADYDLLAASAAVSRAERAGAGWRITAGQTVGVRWQGPVRVDGRPWPATDGRTVWIPAGRHVVESDAGGGEGWAPVRLLQLNGDLRGTRFVPGGLEIEYESESRAAALFNCRPSLVQVDAGNTIAPVMAAGTHFTVLLPPGKRTARISCGQ